MSECNKCQGNKFLRNEEGAIMPCPCILMDQVSQYISPLRKFKTPNFADVKASKVINKSQAIIKNDQNMKGLIKVVASEWFPKEFRIATLEDLNNIGFDKHPEFKSISGFVYNCTNFILDCGFLSNIRLLKDGITKIDSLYAIEMAKNILAKEGGTIIIILPTRFNDFKKAYGELFECLSELGIELFRDGKYQPLLGKEVNDEC